MKYIADANTESVKVLFVSPTGQMHGGGERSGFEFCKFLIKQGYTVETVLPKNENRQYIEELKENGMQYYIAPYVFNGINKSFDLSSDIIGEAFSIVDVINKTKPDIIISNMSAFTQGAVAACITGIPHVWMERGNGYRIEDEWVRKILDFVFKYSNAVIVNSSGLSKIYSDYYDTETVTVRSFTDMPKVGLNMGIGETRIIAVSRLSPEKNILELLKAVEIMAKKYSSNHTKVVIMGHDNGIGNDLRNYVNQSDILSERVEFKDFKPDPWESFGPNDIYVNTSLYESVGRSTVEALRLGLPVVLADIPGHDDIFDLAGGYKYKSGYPNDLAEKLNYIINNHGKAKEKALEWKELVESAFNEYNCNKDALDLLNRIKEQRNPVSAVEMFQNVLDRTRDQPVENDERIAELEHQVTVLSNPGLKKSLKYLLHACRARIRRLLGRDRFMLD